MSDERDYDEYDDIINDNNDEEGQQSLYTNRRRLPDLPKADQNYEHLKYRCRSRVKSAQESPKAQPEQSHPAPSKWFQPPEKEYIPSNTNYERTYHRSYSENIHQRTQISPTRVDTRTSPFGFLDNNLQVTRAPSGHMEPASTNLDYGASMHVEPSQQHHNRRRHHSGRSQGHTMAHDHPVLQPPRVYHGDQQTQPAEPATNHRMAPPYASFSRHPDEIVVSRHQETTGYNPVRSNRSRRGMAHRQWYRTQPAGQKGYHRYNRCGKQKRKRHHQPVYGDEGFSSRRRFDHVVPRRDHDSSSGSRLQDSSLDTTFMLSSNLRTQTFQPERTELNRRAVAPAENRNDLGSPSNSYEHLHNQAPQKSLAESWTPPDRQTQHTTRNSKHTPVAPRKEPGRYYQSDGLRKGRSKVAYSLDKHSMEGNQAGQEEGRIEADQELLHDLIIHDLRDVNPPDHAYEEPGMISSNEFDTSWYDYLPTENGHFTSREAESDKMFYQLPENKIAERDNQQGLYSESQFKTYEPTFPKPEQQSNEDPDFLNIPSSHQSKPDEKPSIRQGSRSLTAFLQLDNKQQKESLAKVTPESPEHSVNQLDTSNEAFFQWAGEQESTSFTGRKPQSFNTFFQQQDGHFTPFEFSEEYITTSPGKKYHKEYHETLENLAPSNLANKNRESQQAEVDSFNDEESDFEVFDPAEYGLDGARKYLLNQPPKRDEHNYSVESMSMKMKSQDGMVPQLALTQESNSIEPTDFDIQLGGSNMDPTPPPCWIKLNDEGFEESLLMMGKRPINTDVQNENNGYSKLISGIDSPDYEKLDMESKAPLPPAGIEESSHNSVDPVEGIQETDNNEKVARKDNDDEPASLVDTSTGLKHPQNPEKGLADTKENYLIKEYLRNVQIFQQQVESCKQNILQQYIVEGKKCCSGSIQPEMSSTSDNPDEANKKDSKLTLSPKIVPNQGCNTKKTPFGKDVRWPILLSAPVTDTANEPPETVQLDTDTSYLGTIDEVAKLSNEFLATTLLSDISPTLTDKDEEPSPFKNTEVVETLSVKFDNKSENSDQSLANNEITSVTTQLGTTAPTDLATNVTKEVNSDEFYDSKSEQHDTDLSSTFQIESTGMSMKSLAKKGQELTDKEKNIKIQQTSILTAVDVQPNTNIGDEPFQGTDIATKRDLEFSHNPSDDNLSPHITKMKNNEVTNQLQENISNITKSDSTSMYTNFPTEKDAMITEIVSQANESVTQSDALSVADQQSLSAEADALELEGALRAERISLQDMLIEKINEKEILEAGMDHINKKCPSEPRCINIWNKQAKQVVETSSIIAHLQKALNVTRCKEKAARRVRLGVQEKMRKEYISSIEMKSCIPPVRSETLEVAEAIVEDILEQVYQNQLLMEGERSPSKSTDNMSRGEQENKDNVTDSSSVEANQEQQSDSDLLTKTEREDRVELLKNHKENPVYSFWSPVGLEQTDTQSRSSLPENENVGKSQRRVSFPQDIPNKGEHRHSLPHTGSVRISNESETLIFQVGNDAETDQSGSLSHADNTLRINQSELSKFQEGNEQKVDQPAMPSQPDDAPKSNQSKSSTFYENNDKEIDQSVMPSQFDNVPQSNQSKSPMFHAEGDQKIDQSRTPPQLDNEYQSDQSELPVSQADNNLPTNQSESLPQLENMSKGEEPKSYNQLFDDEPKIESPKTISMHTIEDELKPQVSQSNHSFENQQLVEEEIGSKNNNAETSVEENPTTLLRQTDQVTELEVHLEMGYGTGNYATQYGTVDSDGDLYRSAIGLRQEAIMRNLHGSQKSKKLVAFTQEEGRNTVEERQLNGEKNEDEDTSWIERKTKSSPTMVPKPKVHLENLFAGTNSVDSIKSGLRKKADGVNSFYSTKSHPTDQSLASQYSSAAEPEVESNVVSTPQPDEESS